MSGREWGAFLPMVPPAGLTHNDLVAVTRAGGGAAIVKGPALRAAEADILPRLARLAPPEPLGSDGSPLALSIAVCWPTGGDHAQGEPMAAAPDWDNVAKVLGDLLQRAGWVADDRLVADGSVAKAWADPAGIRVDVREVR